MNWLLRLIALRLSLSQWDSIFAPQAECLSANGALRICSSVSEVSLTRLLLQVCRSSAHPTQDPHACHSQLRDSRRVDRRHLPLAGARSSRLWRRGNSLKLPRRVSAPNEAPSPRWPMLKLKHRTRNAPLVRAA
jgi:hypothetical protein